MGRVRRTDPTGLPAIVSPADPTQVPARDPTTVRSGMIAHAVMIAPSATTVPAAVTPLPAPIDRIDRTGANARAASRPDRRDRGPTAPRPQPVTASVASSAPAIRNAMATGRRALKSARSPIVRAAAARATLHLVTAHLATLSPETLHPATTVRRPNPAAMTRSTRAAIPPAHRASRPAAPSRAVTASLVPTGRAVMVIGRPAPTAPIAPAVQTATPRAVTAARVRKDAPMVPVRSSAATTIAPSAIPAALTVPVAMDPPVPIVIAQTAIVPSATARAVTARPAAHPIGQHDLPTAMPVRPAAKVASVVHAQKAAATGTVDLQVARRVLKAADRPVAEPTAEAPVVTVPAARRAIARPSRPAAPVPSN